MKNINYIYIPCDVDEDFDEDLSFDFGSSYVKSQYNIFHNSINLIKDSFFKDVFKCYNDIFKKENVV